MSFNLCIYKTYSKSVCMPMCPLKTPRVVPGAQVEHPWLSWHLSCLGPHRPQVPADPDTGQLERVNVYSFVVRYNK